jgi:hypothetical protein
MKGFRVIALVLLAITVAAVTPAFAQTVDMRGPAVDVLTWVAGALGTALTVLASVAVRFVFAKFGLANSQYEQNLNDRLSDIIYKGIDYAYATAVNEVQKPGSGLAEVKFDNYLMSVAASYIAPRAAGILATFKITQEKLEDMIWARIPSYMQTIPVTGGASTPATVKEVNRVTGGGGGSGEVSKPVVVQPRTETPLPESKASGIFSEAPNTGS